MPISYKVDIDVLPDGFVAYRVTRVSGWTKELVAGTTSSLPRALAKAQEFIGKDANCETTV